MRKQFVPSIAFNIPRLNWDPIYSTETANRARPGKIGVETTPAEYQAMLERTHRRRLTQQLLNSLP